MEKDTREESGLEMQVLQPREPLLAHWDFPLRTVEGLDGSLAPSPQSKGWDEWDRGGEAEAVLQENMKSCFGSEPCASTFLSPSLLPLTRDLGV